VDDEFCLMKKQAGLSNIYMELDRPSASS